MNGQKIYTLTLTQEELSIIGASLAEMPYRQVATVIGSIDRQIRAQDAPPMPPMPPAQPVPPANTTAEPLADVKAS